MLDLMVRRRRFPGRRVAIVAGFVLAVFALWPYPTDRLDSTTFVSTRIVDRHGRLLHEKPSATGGYARWVRLADISPYLVLSTLSAEDANFRQHPGVDPSGVVRALWLNAQKGRIAYGGSSITQQLAGLLVPRPRTLPGKLLEARDAIRLELALSKDEILEQYLNRAYYGRNAYGIEAAARRFFGKSAAALTLDEAALLAILPRAPTAYDPARFPERALARRAHVLARLAKRGWEDAGAAERAAAQPMHLVTVPNPVRSRHLLDALPGEALAGSPIVTATVDVELEDRLRARLGEHLADLTERSVDQAAIVVLDNATGDVLALLGSRDYAESDARGAVNAALTPRPPGSTLKPFVYALAVRQGAHASTPVFDVPTSWAGFVPRNASLDYQGRVSLREALGSSLNVPAVRAADSIGIERVASFLRELGLGGERIDASRQGLSLSLGGAPVRLLDLANAYATLARGGVHLPWRLTEPGRKPGVPRRVLDRASAFLITEMLSDASARRREFGVETPLELPFPAAVKTGTSKSFCDNFVVGYTAEVTVAVWAGNFDGRPTHGLLAMQGAAPLWRDAMLLAMEQRTRREATPPPELTTAEVCPISGLLRGPACPAGRHEHVVRGRLSPQTCTWHRASGALGVPPELRGFDGAGHGSVIETAGAAIRIANPIDGARFVIDPSLPRSRQALRLRALLRAPEANVVRWEVDDRAIAEARAPFSGDWLLEAGEHRLRAVALAANGSQFRVMGLHEVRVFVRGRTKK